MDQLISVIVPVYNVEKYLDRCVASIVNQTYSNLEVILVDDGSKDQSGLICDNWSRKDNRIRVIHKANGGLSSARNCGINNSHGEYIAFIDSDDWIDPEMYETLYRNIKQFDADVSDIESIITETEDKYVNSKELISVFKGIEILKDYFVSAKYSCCRKLYSRAIIADIRFPVGKINEDIATNFLFLKNASILVKSSLKMYYYFRNPSSITGESFKPKDFDLLDACKNLYEYASFDNELKKYAEVKKISAYYALIGRYISYPDSGFSDIHERVNFLITHLRQGYWKLLFSHINLKKKILITGICVIGPWNCKNIYKKVKRIME